MLPAAPQTRTVPLPSPTPTATSPNTDDSLFPLNLLQVLQVTQEPTLRSIILTTPVHVHLPCSHIALVYGDVPGQRVNALELIHCLRIISSQTTQRTHTQVEITYMNVSRAHLMATYGNIRINRLRYDHLRVVLLDTTRCWGMTKFGDWNHAHSEDTVSFTLPDGIGISF